MRIISKFHDYYDAAMGLGQDQTLMFVRNTEELDPKKFSFMLAPRQTQLFLIGQTLDINFFHLSVGSTVYHGVTLDVKSTNRAVPTRQRTCVYDWAQVTAWCHKAITTKNHSRINEFFDRRSYYQNPNLSEFLTQSSEHEQTLIMHGYPILHGTYDKVWANPVLRNLEFYRVMEPSILFQELQMWISSVNTNPSQPPIAIDDGVRVQQHGFDRFSFRKLPTKPR